MRKPYVIAILMFQAVLIAAVGADAPKHDDKAHSQAADQDKHAPAAADHAPKAHPAPTDTHKSVERHPTPTTNSATKGLSPLVHQLSPSAHGPGNAEAVHTEPPAKPKPDLRLEGLENDVILPPDRRIQPTTDYFEKELETSISVARELRKIGEFERAEVNLKNVLRRRAPDRIHQEAMMEMVHLAEAQNQLGRAQQILAQYATRFPADSRMPEILLRRGSLYRRMGAYELALSKYYAVLSTALSIQPDDMDYYQRIVLQAQIEISDTYYAQGDYEHAANFLIRLLRLDSNVLDKEKVLFKLIQSENKAGNRTEARQEAHRFLRDYPHSELLPEVRFVLASIYLEQGQKPLAMEQIHLLLQEQHSGRPDDQALRYWQQRVGNEIANLLYDEGDYLNALQVYRNLAKLDTDPAWRFPVYYQIGLVYERLKQPRDAADYYARIDARAMEGSPHASPALEMIVKMANWRADHLKWKVAAVDQLPGPLPGDRAPVADHSEKALVPAPK